MLLLKISLFSVLCVSYLSLLPTKAFGNTAIDFSFFINNSYNGNFSTDLQRLISQKNPSIDFSKWQISQVELFYSGKGNADLIIAGNIAAMAVLDSPDFIDIATLSHFGKDNSLPWKLAGKGDVYLESIDLVLEQLPPQSLPDGEYFCSGAAANASFKVFAGSGSHIKVEVISRFDFVWVMAGMGDQILGPWLPQYPQRKNFRGGAIHWTEFGINHWSFSIPRTYDPSTSKTARIFFLANAYEDNPFLGGVYDWCDPFN